MLQAQRTNVDQGLGIVAGVKALIQYKTVLHTLIFINLVAEYHMADITNNNFLQHDSFNSAMQSWNIILQYKRQTWRA